DADGTTSERGGQTMGSLKRTLCTVAALAVALPVSAQTAGSPAEKFWKEYNVQIYERLQNLVPNPFAFEGKTIVTRLRFERMIARSEGLFTDGPKIGGALYWL